MRTQTTKYQISRMGDGWVVTIEDCCQRVFTSTKECEEFVGGMVMSALTVSKSDNCQVIGSWTNDIYDWDERRPVKPEWDEQ